MSYIKDMALKDEGHQKIAWAEKHMPVLNAIGDRLEQEQPFRGKRIALSIHLEAKTAQLVRTLARGGAEMFVTGSNARSTQDCVCAALADEGHEVFAIHGASPEKTQLLWKKTLSCMPDIVIDDGAELVHLLLGECSDYAGRLIGGCEETTSGIIRLRQWEREKRLPFPMMSVNDARCKSYFDNTYGTGQSTWDSIMRTTNLELNGKTVVVAGYGYCGKGVAHIAKGLNAQVIVTEADPVKAILAIMDGFRAMSMEKAAPLGDIFVTVTGCCDVIRPCHFSQMKNGAILANAGHFDIELDLAGLEAMSCARKELRKNLTGYTLRDGRTIAVVADGNLCNIAAADGHPVEIMDMSFALQAMAAEYLLQQAGELQPGLVRIPDAIDLYVAMLKLKALGGSYEILTQEQQKYLGLQSSIR